jgi:hypothetical protein
MTLYTNQSKAQAIVDDLNATSDDGWTYHLVARGRYYAIGVFDETGYWVGDL